MDIRGTPIHTHYKRERERNMSPDNPNYLCFLVNSNRTNKKKIKLNSFTNYKIARKKYIYDLF